MVSNLNYQHTISIYSKGLWAKHIFFFTQFNTKSKIIKNFEEINIY